MNWSQAIDSYCERTDPSFWAEPINFLTNAAFMLAALALWPRMRGLFWARILCVTLFCIGVGSALFHSFAQTWAALADVVPIVAFVLIYIYVANHFYWQLSTAYSAIGALLFIPFAVITIPLFNLIPLLGSSAGYMPVPLLIAIYAVLLRRRLPQVAGGLAIGAALLLLSLAFRTADLPLCRPIPIGTHFMWHVLNAVMLGWMIEVYRRHMLADVRPQR